MGKEKLNRNGKTTPTSGTQTNSLDVNFKGDCMNNSTTVLPTTTLNPLNIVELTKDKKDAMWSENGEDMRINFHRTLIMLKAGMDFDLTLPKHLFDKHRQINDRGTCPFIQFNRLLIGYNGLGYHITPTRCGLMSEASVGVDSSKCTKDHHMGVTKVGIQVVNAFEACDFDFDYMVNEWLYEHLHYWFTIRITKEEHKKENLSRNEHSVEEKENFVHYNEGNIKVIVTD